MAAIPTAAVAKDHQQPAARPRAHQGGRQCERERRDGAEGDEPQNFAADQHAEPTEYSRRGPDRDRAFQDVHAAVVEPVEDRPDGQKGNRHQQRHQGSPPPTHDQNGREHRQEDQARVLHQASETGDERGQQWASVRALGTRADQGVEEGQPQCR